MYLAQSEATPAALHMGQSPAYSHRAACCAPILVCGRVLAPAQALVLVLATTQLPHAADAAAARELLGFLSLQ